MYLDLSTEATAACSHTHTFTRWLLPGPLAIRLALSLGTALQGEARVAPVGGRGADGSAADHHHSIGYGAQCRTDQSCRDEVSYVRNWNYM